MWKGILVLVWLSTIKADGTIWSRKATNKETVNYRLPTALKPTLYDLYLHPDLETGQFSGQERIWISVLESTTQIILHSLNLNFSSVYVTEPNGLKIEVTNYHWEAQREFLIIDLSQELNVGMNIILGLIFSGDMMNKIVGLYSSAYWTPDGEKRSLATTQFEPVHARKAFPCYDEPALKAQFRITLVHPSDGGYHALSNLDINHKRNQGRYIEVEFNTTVPMSTYLACFIISDFEHIQKSVNSQGIGENFDIRLFATPHQIEKVNFALDTAVAITEYFIKYYNVGYPLPKLDLIAIPDFSSNAMENWGLITYRETALLYDPNYSSTWNRQRIAAVISHELAHMWFGNLVTMNWWDDLWLNEGFARFMEYKGVNAVYPDWGMPDQFLLHALHGVLKFDSTTASHPIVNTVNNPDEITEVFDTISYEKAASVIRMLEGLIGSNKLEEAITNYLTKYQYQNAISEYFFDEVVNVGVQYDIKAIMRTWIEQMGYPVVDVKRSTPTTFSLTQKRFFANIDDYAIDFNDSEFNYTWSIPITFFTDSDQITDHQLIFNFENSSIDITVPENTRWIKLNSKQVGFYRVNYEHSLWIELIEALIAQPSVFSISDRAHLLNDAFALAEGSQLSYSIALDATAYLSSETEFVPWHVATMNLQIMQSSLSSSGDTYARFLKYANKLLAQIYQKVTWTVNADNHLENRLRVSVLTAACGAGMPDCIEQAAQKFTAWLSNPDEEKPAPDLREIVYYYGMQRVGNEKIWEQMWNIFIAEQDAAEKLKLMYGLSGIRVPWILYRFINLANTEEYVRRQDYFTCLQNIAANPVGTNLVWEYLRDHWPQLVSRFGLNDRYFGRMIIAITERFATQTKLEEMTEFFKKYPDAGAGTASRKRAIELVKFNIRWLADKREEIDQWLIAQGF